MFARLTETRAPHRSEPRESSPIYVRLGMTKGAFVMFGVLLVAGIVGFARLETIAAGQRHVIHEQRALLQQHVAVVAQVQAQQRRNLHALREVCRETQTLLGITGATETFVAELAVSPAISRAALPALVHALRVFRGYEVILSEQPSCEKVLNP